ncbi:MAG: hypothetical protein JXR76_26900 [Deltaproteobacteria bacterium]|nr:hypothetical protein [Deltaproteobacteria bacterium]
MRHINISQLPINTISIVLFFLCTSCSDDSKDANKTSAQDTGSDLGTDSNGSDSNSDSATSPGMSTDSGSDSASGTESDGSEDSGTASDSDTEPAAPMFAELWYSVDNLLVHVVLDPATGAFLETHSSTIEGLGLGQNSLTMLKNGGLVGARLVKDTQVTELYYIAQPPRNGEQAAYISLGEMIDGIKIEALYTDCDGYLYAMDTGENDSSAAGNRLIRFTGDFLSKDLSYSVVSDWSTGTVADIDDLAPGINAQGEITDNDGFAIDTGDIYAFNYEAGNGVLVGNGGTWGIHALGGALFTDNTARLYIMSSDATLTQIDPVTFAAIGATMRGPEVAQGNAGWSGLAGPLTDCVTQFQIEVE